MKTVILDFREPTTQKIKPKAIFILKNEIWIDFLNVNQEDLQNTFSQELTSTLAEWQKKYNFNYKSEIDLALSCQAFIRENLKLLSREDPKEFKVFKEVQSFGEEVVNALLQRITIKLNLPFFIEGILHYDFNNFHNSEEHFTDYENNRINLLTSILHTFIIYAEDVINCINPYRVGICQYQKRKEPECGRIFVGGKRTEACSKHERLWAAMKIRRNRQNKPLTT